MGGQISEILFSSPIKGTQNGKYQKTFDVSLNDEKILCLKKSNSLYTHQIDSIEIQSQNPTTYIFTFHNKIKKISFSVNENSLEKKFLDHIMKKGKGPYTVTQDDLKMFVIVKDDHEHVKLRDDDGYGKVDRPDEQYYHRDSFNSDSLKDEHGFGTSPNKSQTSILDSDDDDSSYDSS